MLAQKLFVLCAVLLPCVLTKHIAPQDVGFSREHTKILGERADILFSLKFKDRDISSLSNKEKFETVLTALNNEIKVIEETVPMHDLDPQELSRLNREVDNQIVLGQIRNPEEIQTMAKVLQICALKNHGKSDNNPFTENAFFEATKNAVDKEILRFKARQAA